MLTIKECPKCHSKEGYYIKVSYKGSGIYRYGFINDDWEQEQIENRDISIGIGLFNTDIELDTIYDLIKENMVVKVEEEKWKKDSH